MSVAAFRERRLGAYQALQSHTLVHDRTYYRDGSRQGIILCAGRAGTDLSFVDSSGNNANPGGPDYLTYIEGFPIASFNSDTTWGNAASVQRVLDLRTYLQSAPSGPAFAAGETALIGSSMGTLIALNAMRHNPTLFSAVALIVPAVSLQYFHDNGYEAEMDTAYTDHAGYLTALTTHSPYADPEAYDVGVPILAFISEDDSLAPPQQAKDFIDAIPSAERVSLGSGIGHQAHLSEVDYDLQILDFFAENTA